MTADACNASARMAALVTLLQTPDPDPDAAPAYVLFGYRYVDGSNNKRFASAVFANPTGLKLAAAEDRLTKALDAGECFIATQIGVPECFIWKRGVRPAPDADPDLPLPAQAINDEDHCWHSFTGLAAVEGELAATAVTDARTFEQFLADVEQAGRDGWQAFSVRELREADRARAENPGGADPGGADPGGTDPGGTDPGGGGDLDDELDEDDEDNPLGMYPLRFATVQVIGGKVHGIGVYGEDERADAIGYARALYREHPEASHTIVYRSETEPDNDRIIWEDGAATMRETGAPPAAAKAGAQEPRQRLCILHFRQAILPTTVAALVASPVPLTRTEWRTIAHAANRTWTDLDRKRAIEVHQALVRPYAKALLDAEQRLEHEAGVVGVLQRQHPELTVLEYLEADFDA